MENIYSIVWTQIRFTLITHGHLTNELSRPTRKHTAKLA
jgi:hypothetical protein